MKKKGFTLMELVVTIAILVIIVTLATLTFVGIRRKVLERQYENVVTYLETKAANYAENTGEITVSVEKLIESGYIDPDEAMKVLNPIDKSSMNCYILESTYGQDGYAAVIKENVGETDGKCNQYEIKKEYQICVFNGQTCETKDIATKWYKDNVTLKVLVGNNIVTGANNELVTWRVGGGVDNNLTYTTSTDTVSRETYNVEVTYTFEEKGQVKVAHGTASTVINIDREKPIINTIAVENANVWSNHDKNVSIKSTDGNGSGLSGVYVGAKDCASLSARDWVKSEQSTYTAAFGQKSYNVCVLDNAGNISDVKNFTVEKIDTNPPECTIAVAGTAGNNGWYKSNVTLTIATNDNSDGSGVEKFGLSTSTSPDYNNNTQKVQGDTKGVTYTGYVQDRAGNTKTCTQTVKVDTVKPTCTVEISGTTGENGWYKSKATLTLNPNDATSGIGRKGLITTNSETYNNKASQVQNDTKGTTYYGFVEDAAGNKGSCNKNVKVDTTVPTCNITVAGTKGENSWYISKATLSLSSSDATSGIKNKGLAASASVSYNNKTSAIQGDTVGITYYGYVKDQAGNEGNCNQAVKVDTVKPTCVWKGTSTSWINTNRTINYSCSDATSKCNSANSGGNKTFNATTKTGLIDAYEIKDMAGNKTSCQAKYVDVYVDKTAPTCTQSGGSTSWTSGNRKIYYGCNDADSGCNTTQSGGSIEFSTTTKTANINAYKISDKAGNITNCPAKTANVYVDKTAPTCTQSGDSTSWTSGNRAIYYGCSDTDSGCNTAYSGGSKLFNYTAKTATVNSYTIRDAVGNSTTCPAKTVNVYVDKTAPTVGSLTIVKNSNYNYNSVNVTISGSASDSESGVTGYCLRDTNSSTGCSWSTSVPNSYVFSGNEGSGETKTLYLFAKDAVGNVSSAKSGSYTLYKLCTSKVADGDPSTGGCSTSCGSGTKSTTQKYKDSYLGGACESEVTTSTCYASWGCCYGCECYYCPPPTPPTPTPTPTPSEPACDTKCMADYNSAAWHNCTSSCSYYDGEGTFHSSGGSQAGLHEANVDLYDSMGYDSSHYNGSSGTWTDNNGNCMNCRP